MKKSVCKGFLIALSLVVASCSTQQKEYKQTESGLTYMFYSQNKDRQPQIDEIVKVHLAYYYPEDSLIFNSMDYEPYMILKIEPSEYQGDIYEAFRLMSVGDSASFKFDAVQFFKTTLRHPQLPDFVKEGEPIFVHTKLLEAFTNTEFEEYQQKERQTFMEEQEKLALQEEGLMEQYLINNNIDTPAEDSGLIVVVQEKGEGPKVNPGQMVEVHYTGMLLDGTVFDTSAERGPFNFKLGAGQVIRGWDEGISKLNVGSKAKLIIPSYLAYGDQARGEFIKPYSTLVFDIEVLDAK